MCEPYDSFRAINRRVQELVQRFENTFPEAVAEEQALCPSESSRTEPTKTAAVEESGDTD